MFVFYSVANEGLQRRQRTSLDRASRFSTMLMNDDAGDDSGQQQKGSTAPDPMKSDVGRTDAPQENAGGNVGAKNQADGSHDAIKTGGAGATQGSSENLL